jgi:hypothetical protein
MIRRLADWRQRQADRRRRFDRFDWWRVEERDRRRGLLDDAADLVVPVVNVIGVAACAVWLIVIEA